MTKTTSCGAGFSQRGASAPLKPGATKVARWLKPALLFFLLATPLLAIDNATLEKLIEAGHWKRAKAEIEKAPPTGAQGYYLASRIRMAFGDLDDAAKLGEKAVELSPNDSHFHTQMFEVYGSQAEKASLFGQASLAGKCKRSLNRALEIDPKNVEAMMGGIQFYYRAPGFMGGDKAKAREIPARVAAVDAVRGVEAEIALANLEKKPVNAVELYRKALAANPQSVIARRQLAFRLTYNDKDRNLPEAEKLALEAMKLDPTRKWPHQILAVVAARDGRSQDLDARLTAAEKLFPDDLQPHLSAAVELNDSGKDHARAEALFRKYLSQPPEPGSPPTWFAHRRLGFLLEKQGKKAEAIKELEAAQKERPGDEKIKTDLKRLRG
ncbi:MAG: tetratricopeptide repeat protein [Bryobacteraceae bacterium]